MSKGRKAFSFTRAFEAAAETVNALPEDIRERVAMHFATEMTKRIPSFDPVRWCQRTRIRVSGPVETEEQKIARVNARVREVLG